MMLVVPGLLLAAALALGLAPGAGAVFGRAGALFTSRADYAAAVGLPGAAPAAPGPPLPGWTAEGVWLSLLAAALAVALAAVTVWGPLTRDARIRAARRALRVCSLRLVQPLRRLHSGRLGDDVAWLGVGVAALLGAFSLLR
jgi:multicomponent Na+:H+ antiporter subunit D